ncbi:MAG: methionyl-tRNA formyltransferase [Lachnospiraceae bacterium]|nr:methionyl-tRNA formyltransferase [Lachnospiraceae bacterium]
MKIVFMGTPDFAAASLEAILNAGYEVTAVVTQPDKPQGRSDKLIPSPVKRVALEHGLAVLQPERIKRPEEIEKLRQFPADLYVVAAFGQILSKEILDMPRLGCVNIHASLLPKYRGAAPIQWSILNGESETGITIMQMGLGIDEGDILFQSRVPILPTDTGDSLFDKLTKEGAKTIVEAIRLLEEGALTPVKQDETQATHVGKIDKAMGRLDFSRSARELDRQIRALNSWPSSFTRYKNKQLKIWGAIPLCSDEIPDILTEMEPGGIVKVEKDAFYVQTGEGILKVTDVQLEGKKRMAVRDFLLGIKLQAGEIFER